MTTPGVAYLVRNQEADAGVMITASHNPVEYNGIKFFGADGYKLSDDLEEEIEGILERSEDILPRPAAEGLGVSGDYLEGSQKYIHFLEQTISEDLSGMKSVLMRQMDQPVNWSPPCTRIWALNLKRWQPIPMA